MGDSSPPVLTVGFYENNPPPVFMQGDVLESVPRIQLARVANMPDLSGTSPEAQVVGPANYCEVRAMIISPSCNIPDRSPGLIQVARVEPAEQLSKSNIGNVRRGRMPRLFLLHRHPQHGEQIVKLTDVWSVDREHIDGAQRILALSPWGRSLLVEALHQALCRPLLDPTYNPQEPQPHPAP